MKLRADYISHSGPRAYQIGPQQGPYRGPTGGKGGGLHLPRAPSPCGAHPRKVADIRKRTSPRIILRGHADRSGATQINYKLSEKRAQKVKGLLVKGGIPADSIEISFHGEDEPLIWTADDVPKLLNRRVEVIVR